jgi:hypothetical protein
MHHRRRPQSEIRTSLHTNECNIGVRNGSNKADGGNFVAERAHHCAAGAADWLRKDILLWRLGLLVEDIEPPVTALYVKRTDPNRARHRFLVAGSLLRGMIRQQGGVGVQQRHLELVDGITPNHARGTSDGGYDVTLVINPEKSDLNMIVREKVLKKLRVAIFPSLPRLLFQLDQVFLNCADVGGWRLRGN